VKKKFKNIDTWRQVLWQLRQFWEPVAGLLRFQHRLAVTGASVCYSAAYGQCYKHFLRRNLHLGGTSLIV